MRTLLALLGLVALAGHVSADGGFDGIGAEMGRAVQHTSDTFTAALELAMPLVADGARLAQQGFDHAAAQALAAWPLGR